MGFCVPAKRAQLRLCDKLFTRLGSDDDMESNASTFVVEMRDMSYALSQMSNDSLLLIDELGRGTSTNCGIAITGAICEYLIETGATILLVTHFGQLVSYLATFPSVKHLALEMHAGAQCVQSLISNHYGIALAREIGLLPAIVSDAQAMAQAIENTEFEHIDRSIQKLASRRRAVLRVARPHYVFTGADCHAMCQAVDFLQASG